ncbi:MAG: hypothetical protein V5A28_12445 [Haloarculaceae archaeon]
MSLAHRARENLIATAGLFLVSAVVGLVSLAGLFARGVFALLGWGGPVGGTLAALVPAFVVGLFVAVPVTWLSVLGLSYGVVARAAPRVRRTAHRVRLAAEDLFADATHAASRVVRWLGRKARAAERDERLAGVPAVSAVADVLDPRSNDERAEERVERLNDLYLAGEISEVELDRRVEDVLDEEDVGYADASALDDALAVPSDDD